jgi:hypothetical protein
LLSGPGAVEGGETGVRSSEQYSEKKKRVMGEYAQQAQQLYRTKYVVVIVVFGEGTFVRAVGNRRVEVHLIVAIPERDRLRVAEIVHEVLKCVNGS